MVTEGLEATTALLGRIAVPYSSIPSPVLARRGPGVLGATRTPGVCVGPAGDVSSAGKQEFVWTFQKQENET